MTHLDYSHQDAWYIQHTGYVQSPININSNTATVINYNADLKLHYDKTALYAKDTGQALEVGLTGQALINNRPYILQQFHLHTPSEHTIDHTYHDGELHFVHQADDGKLAVIAIFLQLGSASPSLAAMFSHLNKNRTFDLPISDLLPKNKSYFHYVGSLTTPPLSENVDWYILSEPISVSSNQIKDLHRFYPHNNRHLQALNQRPILYYKA